MEIVDVVDSLRWHARLGNTSMQQRPTSPQGRSGSAAQVLLTTEAGEKETLAATRRLFKALRLRNDDKSGFALISHRRRVCWPSFQDASPFSTA